MSIVLHFLKAFWFLLLRLDWLEDVNIGEAVYILPISLNQESLRDVDGEDTNKTKVFH